MWEFDGLLEAIETAETITLFRHARPDCDAVGSQFGLKQWIEENWPEKRVYALGYDYCSQGNCWSYSDTVSLEVIRDSTAIVLDTANTDRIDDIRCLQARKLVKIDHHPDHTPYGDLSLVFVYSAATCEILGEFFRRQTDKTMSLTTAEYLFRGILTDTLSFRTNNTTEHTLAIAGWLAGFGVRIPEINRELFDKSLKDYRFGSMMRNTVQFAAGNHMAYRIVSDEEMKEWGLTISDVKNFVEEYGRVQEIELYAVFCENTSTDPVTYEGSLRSHTIPINLIAEQFNGGGHVNACGVRGLPKEKLEELIQVLASTIHN
ncbi:MAG: bifunctional oligoribonuclease/PAP phosphatase NrnA [Solobacterium sp.]|nr:bifunctional oligoribonuclease/PAP phosphatase NrnA [Solobacterium sp.]